MRVVAGSARGRKLVAPPGATTRPTTDRVREAIFNALHSLGVIDGADVVDLFAGSGALGIEALSRGAATVTFVERDRAARAAVEDNLASTGLSSAEVVAGDAMAFLARTPATFGLALLDPPYGFDEWSELIRALAPRLDDDAVVVIEGRDEPDLGGLLTVLRSKRYGGTVVTFARPVPGPSAPSGDHT